MKLHLGCGSRILDGWVNCDFKKADGVHVMDIRHLPFADDSAEEIMAIHVCEHFYKHDLPDVLKEWRRVLKPNGRISLELPCLDRVLSHFINGSGENMTLWALYGEPRTHVDGEPALHKWCWSKKAFKEQLQEAGFTGIEEEKPQHHQPSRDMRFLATK